MKKADVKVGETYLAKVSGKLQRVRITQEFSDETPIGVKDKPWKPGTRLRVRRKTEWNAVNERTGRIIRIKSAQRLRPIGPPRLSMKTNEFHQCEECGVPTSIARPVPGPGGPAWVCERSRCVQAYERGVRDTLGDMKYHEHKERWLEPDPLLD